MNLKICFILEFKSLADVILANHRAASFENRRGEWDKDSVPPARIKFERKSVGATGNIIMAACQATGTSEIFNAACEPEIVDLCNFIDLIGIKIKGMINEKLHLSHHPPVKNHIKKGCKNY